MVLLCWLLNPTILGLSQLLKVLLILIKYCFHGLVDDGKLVFFKSGKRPVLN